MIAHPVIQSHLSDTWLGSRSSSWPRWRSAVLLPSVLLCPPLWVLLSLPFSCGRAPLVRLSAQLASHVHLLVLLSLLVTAGGPSPALELALELALALWLAGAVLAELTAGSGRAGWRLVRLVQLCVAVVAVVVHAAAVTGNGDRHETL